MTAGCAVRPGVAPALRHANWRGRLGAGLAGTVLELGAGDGANFAYLPKDVTWIGLEPDRRRAAALRRVSRDWPGGGAVLECRAESVPLADGGVDAVLATLVLCSVRSQDRVLAEVRRVLRPGGVFRFLEHVASPRGTWTRRLERAYAPWSVLTDHGCHPARDTEDALRRSGFAHVDVERFALPGPLGTDIAHVAGEAVVA